MNRLKVSLIIASILLTSVISISAKALNVQRLESHLQTRVAGDNIGVGLVVGVMHADKNNIISVGKANKYNAQGVNKESLFEIGSISKTFTSIMLADMHLKGEVSLDDPVAQYLPKNVTMPRRNGMQITLLHLATHTSGLPRLPTGFMPKNIANPYADYTVEMMYEFLSGYQLTRDIGVKPEYSNLGMGLLGHVLALKAGKSYEQLVKERILQPLGMKNTSITLSAAQKKYLTVGHDLTGKATSPWDIPALAGAGALRSSAQDMMRYLAANMGLSNTDLSAAMELSQQYRHEFVVDSLSIGLGWFIADASNGATIWHNGGTGGYRAFIGFNKKIGKGVFVLANSQDDVDVIGHAILTEQIESLKMVQTKTLSLSKTELMAFTGEYQLAPNFTITISENNGSLFAQATGQQQLPIFATSKNEFIYKAVSASITFEKSENGEVDALVLHQNGHHVARKIN